MCSEISWFIVLFMGLAALYTTYVAWLAHKGVLKAKEEKDKVARMINEFADFNKHSSKKLID